jgi:hypothetical protein
MAVKSGDKDTGLLAYNNDTMAIDPARATGFNHPDVNNLSCKPWSMIFYPCKFVFTAVDNDNTRALSTLN